MNRITRTIHRRPLRALLTLTLALLALGLLWPPGPYRTFAQEGAPADLAATYRVNLPLLANGPALAPDLLFEPAAIELAPGGTANVGVRVDSGADLRGATFDLPAVQEGIWSSFAAAPDGLSGTLTITASTALEADERMLDVQGRSGVDSSRTWVGALKLKTTATLTAKTVYVDALNGNDTNSGTQSAPLKTIKKAFTKVVAGDTVKLLPGQYNSTHSGDTFPLLVPSGVKLVGTLASTGAKQSFLSASSSAAGETGLTFAGDATVKDLELDVFGIAIQASKGTLTLSNLNLLNKLNVDLKGTAQATLTNANLFLSNGEVGAQVAEQAKLTMDGGKMEGSSGCLLNGAGIQVGRTQSTDTAHVTLKNGAILQNTPGSALRMEAKVTATLINAKITRTSAASCVFTSPSIIMLDATSLTTDNTTIMVQGGQSTTGIQGPNAGNVTLKNTTISGHTERGVGFQGNGQLVVENSTITANNIGIDADTSALPHIKINGSKIDSNTSGILVKTPELVMTNSSLSRNVTGILVKGSFSNQTGGAGVFLDGRNGAGNNVIRDNTATGVDIQGTGQVFAGGNTWNANTQGADATGHYAPGTVVRSGDANRQGANFRLLLTGSIINL